MEHNNFIFLSMHLAWWMVWFVAIIFLIINFYKLPRQINNLNEKPLEILQKRFAAGQISRLEYLKDREIIMVTKVNRIQ